MKEKQDILLAFFDILGTSKNIYEGNYQKVYDYYQAMSKLCSDTHTPIAVVNNVKKLETSCFHSDYIIINYDLNHCFFSDTFIIWMELDSFLQPTLAGFLEKCCVIFCEAIKREIPLRGVISAGTAIMDKENNLFLGNPIAEAAKAEPQQNWLGMGIGKSILNIHPMDMEYVLPYIKHIKNKDATLLGGWVLDWPNWWRKTEKKDVVPFINKMNQDIRFDNYYNNCSAFFDMSKHREEIWKMFMIFQDINTLSNLLKMRQNINDELKETKRKEIEMLTSKNVLDFIHSLFSTEKCWVDQYLEQCDKEVLLKLQNGIILVNHKEVNILL